jgi:hypothetical protein
VSEQLHSLFTSGGSEYPGQAITSAVRQLEWSSDPAAMKFVFVAGNEEFDQGPVSATAAMELASAKDINVQLIFCGTGDSTWESAAKIAKSDLLTIDQNKVAEHVPSPYDAEILRLGDELNSTYIAYGRQGQVSLTRQRGADISSATMGMKVAIERMQLKTRTSYDNSSWDLVDALANNNNFLQYTQDDGLPAALQGKTLAEMEQLVKEHAKKREQLKAKISKLEVMRAAFLAGKTKTGESYASSLHTELMKSTKKVAGKKGYKF